MSRRTPMITWRRAETALPETDVVPHPGMLTAATSGPALDSGSLARPMSRLVRACTTCGIPTDPRAMTPREDAVSLLKLAAEAEHALMVQYLYSAGSVGRSPLGRTITDIAVEEMGHLITVQNLLLALTGDAHASIPFELHLGRDALRRNSSINPLPFTLEPVSRSALAKFTVVERPDEIDDPQVLAQVNEMESDLAQQGVDPNPIFALYAAIRWIFQPSDNPVGRVHLSKGMGFRPGWHVESSDFADPATIERYASTPTEWGASADLIVMRARNHSEALEAIDDVTEQGEGPSSSADSHFSRFLDAYNEFDDMGGIEVLAIPRTPFVNGQLAPEDSRPTRITNGHTVLWARLFNIQYELMLLDIAYAITRPHGSDQRHDMIRLSRRQMTQVIRTIASNLSERPIANAGDAVAGAPYGIENEYPPDSDQDFVRRFEELTSASESISEQIRESADHSGDVFGQLNLASVLNVAGTRADIIRSVEA